MQGKNMEDGWFKQLEFEIRQVSKQLWTGWEIVELIGHSSDRRKRAD